MVITEPGNGRAVNVEAELRIERLRVAIRQIPVAATVTVINAALLSVVLVSAGQDQLVYAWLAVAILVAGARVALWAVFRRVDITRQQYRRWAIASTCS